MAKSLNLIGQRFGHLVVVERAENTPRGNTQWKCICDCGKTKVALGYDLNHGRTTTCGCKSYLVGEPSPHRIDLVGNRYGKLTVVSLNEEKSKNGVLVWNCKCDCGGTCTARGGNLKSGRTTHCGCVKQVANNFIDLTGNKYGRLTVLSVERRDGKKVYWNCVCDCGGKCIVPSTDLKSGHTRSCGCLLKESRSINASRHRLENMDIPTDPDTYRKLRTEFHSMHHRCSPSYHSANSYYNLGVTVCDEWKDFNNFLSWALSNGFEHGLTLDRIDVNGNYSPDNCRWATNKVQQNNKRNNFRITIDGETKTLSQWSEIYGIGKATVRQRIKRGWPQERWFEPPR